jgi:hypothetical protein
VSEITFNYQLSVNNPPFVQNSQRQVRISQLAKGGGVPGQVVAATGPGTAISLSGLTTPGVIEVTNLDDANYVDIGDVRILSGETWVWRVRPGASLTAIANTAAVKLRVMVYEA